MIGPQRQLFNKVLNLVATRAGEAGGIVSRIASSGSEAVGYIDDISDNWPIGIQLHNVEHIDEGYQYNPWTQRGVRRVSKISEIVGVSTHCIVDTNFVDMSASPHSGKKAYLDRLECWTLIIGFPQIKKVNELFFCLMVKAILIWLLAIPR